MMMEALPKPGKFLFRGVHDTGFLGCFMAPRRKRQAPSSPNSSSSSSSREDFFSSDDPDLSDPLLTTPNSASFKITIKCTKSSRTSDADATEESFVFSPHAPPDAVLKSPSFRTLSDPLLSTFSYNNCTMETSKLGSSSGGRSKPLPPPVWLPLPAPKDAACEPRFNSGAFVSTSDGSEVGSWSIRRVKGVTAVVGLPLPPPSIATKLLPGLESFEFEELLEGTREFAPESCMEKGAFGAVYRARVKNAGVGKVGRETAVVRLNVNENQTLKDWKSDVQMLAQLPDSNICLVKGYCAHEDVDVHSMKITSERLLVFEQSPNGTLHDYLCGSRSKTQLNWSARISIVLGAARGLMYLHDRAPLQIVYREFKGSSVLLDKDYTPRLAGYGLAVMSSPPDRKSSLSSMMKTSQAHAKRNVWSFGIVLLELLTGKYSLDTTFLCNEKNFVSWAEPFLKDESKLTRILDSRLKSKCPSKGAWKVAELAVQCLKKKELQRPSMSRVVDALKSIKEDFGSRVLQPQQQKQQQQHHYNSKPSLETQQRRATFGGLSFRDLGERSKALDRQFLSLNSRSSVSTSSEDNDSRSGLHFCNCALQSGKAGENAKASSCRVF